MARRQIHLGPRGKAEDNTRATFELVLQGFAPGSKLAVDFYARTPPFESGPDMMLSPEQRAERGLAPVFDQWLGSVRGTVAPVGTGTAQCLTPETPPITASADEIYVGVLVGQSSGSGTMFRFVAPAHHTVALIARVRDMEEIASVPAIQTRSWNALPTLPRARAKASYPFHAGNDLRFYNDACEDEAGAAGMFHDYLEALMQARHLIFIADWSFHPNLTLARSNGQGVSIGELLLRRIQAEPDLLVVIHTWDHINIGAPDAPNDDGDDALVEICKRLGMGKKRPDRLLWRASSRTGVGWTHHQKFMVCDIPSPAPRPSGGPATRSLRAFVGGIDVTQGRFDWPEHRVEEARNGSTWHAPHGWFKPPDNDWYNAETGGKVDLPRQPWHDIHCRIDGPAAWDLLREFTGRWNKDPSLWGLATQGDTSSGHIAKVNQKFDSLFDSGAYIQQWEPGAGPWVVQICRSIEHDHWGPSSGTHPSPARKRDGGEFAWHLSPSFERSIQDSYLQAIEASRRFIYIESQYFTGSGRLWSPTRTSVENRLPETLALRIQRAATEGGDFHVYITIPMFPEGSPSDEALLGVRQYQWNAIKGMMAMIRRMGIDPARYVSLGFLTEWNVLGALTLSGNRDHRLGANRRYQVYVHSKHMIVDDAFAIIGTANLNERSLAGDRDTEIVASMWLDGQGDREGARQALKFHRERLFNEHFGGRGPNFDHPESPECVNWVREVGDDNWCLMMQGLHAGTRGARAVERRGHWCRWPMDVTAANHLTFHDEVPAARVPGHNPRVIPDGIPTEPAWFWDAPGDHEPVPVPILGHLITAGLIHSWWE